MVSRASAMGVTGFSGENTTTLSPTAGCEPGVPSAAGASVMSIMQICMQMLATVGQGWPVTRKLTVPRPMWRLMPSAYPIGMVAMRLGRVSTPRRP